MPTTVGNLRKFMYRHMADVRRTFVREVEVESRNVVLKINQSELGDVGCVVWDAGLVLAKYIDHLHSKCEQYFQNKSIIDLGSGTGIVGLAAASVGGNVILTDIPDLLPLLELNVKVNSHLLLGSAKAEVLLWEKVNENCTQPDFLLVGDCIYYEKSLQPLVDTLSRLSGSHTEILLSYEDRDYGNKLQFQTKFLDLIKTKFTIENIPCNEMHPEFQSSDIHILKLRKK